MSFLNLHYMKKISQKLRKLRDAKGYSQEYVAENMGVSSSTVSRIETDCSIILGKVKSIVQNLICCFFSFKI